MTNAHATTAAPQEVNTSSPVSKGSPPTVSRAPRLETDTTDSALADPTKASDTQKAVLLLPRSKRTSTPPSISSLLKKQPIRDDTLSLRGKLRCSSLRLSRP
jgi:hypothetical protein